MAKKDTKEEMVDCFEYFFPEKFTEFMRDVISVFELYHVDEDDDWVAKAVGEDNERNVRLIRTVYLMSKIAESHAGMLCGIKTAYPKLWLRMKKLTEEEDQITP